MVKIIMSKFNSTRSIHIINKSAAFQGLLLPILPSTQISKMLFSDLTNPDPNDIWEILQYMANQLHFELQIEDIDQINTIQDLIDQTQE